MTAKRPSFDLPEARDLLRLCNTLHETIDVTERKRQMLSGLCRIVNASAGVCVVAHFARAVGTRTTVAAVEVTMDGTDSSAKGGGRVYPAASLPWGEFVRRAARSLGRDMPPASLTTDWCSDSGRTRRAGGQRMYSFLPFPGTRVVACLSLAGPTARRSFGPRSLAVVSLMHAEMSWIYKSDLLLASPEALSLSPRQRQTLQFLLTGYSEKQIATHLRLSHNTVHHYVKALHRHFHVATRAELLARWVQG